MSQAIQDLYDFLAMSPSVVFPDEVLEYVDAIKAENDKLRELIKDITVKIRPSDFERCNADLDRLEDENDRLRKMCADMLTCINAYKARKLICWECEHHRAIDDLRSACFLGSDARELGIEVG